MQIIGYGEHEGAKTGGNINVGKHIKHVHREVWFGQVPRMNVHGFILKNIHSTF